MPRAAEGAEVVTSFFTGFQGRASGTPCAGRARANRSSTEDAKCRRGMREGVRAGPPGPQRGMIGDCSAPVASTKAAPFGRKPCGAAGRRQAADPASLSMWLLAVTRSPAPRYVDLCGWSVQRCRELFYRSRSQSRALLRRVRAPHGRPLSSDLAR